MEHRIPYTVPPAKGGHKAECQYHCREKLEAHRAQNYIADEGAQLIVHAFLAGGLHHQLAVVKGESFPRKEKHHRQHRHKSQTADLYHTQNHGLSEHGPIGIGILHDKSRYAGGAYGGEQRIPEGSASLPLGGDGQAQKGTSHQYNEHEA